MDGRSKLPQLVLEPDHREARVEAGRLLPPMHEMIVAQGWRSWPRDGGRGRGRKRTDPRYQLEVVLIGEVWWVRQKGNGRLCDWVGGDVIR